MKPMLKVSLDKLNSFPKYSELHIFLFLLSIELFIGRNEFENDVKLWLMNILNPFIRLLQYEAKFQPSQLLN